jgi:hypothetical protein
MAMADGRVAIDFHPSDDVGDENDYDLQGLLLPFLINL